MKKKVLIGIGLVIALMIPTVSAQSFEIGQCFTVIDCKDIFPQPKFYTEIDNNNVYLVTFFPEDVVQATVFWGDRNRTTSDLYGHVPIVWPHFYERDLNYPLRVKVSYADGRDENYTYLEYPVLMINLED